MTDEDPTDRDFRVYDAPVFPLRYIVVILWSYRHFPPPGVRLYSGIAMNDDASEIEHCTIPEWGTPGRLMRFRDLPRACQAAVMNDISESFS